MTADDVRQLIRSTCAIAGSQSAWAKTIGISPAFLSDVLGGGREPSPAILEPLGLERVTMYQPVKVNYAPRKRRKRK